jgi:pantothenate kinase
VLVRAVLADSATPRLALAAREKSTGGRGHFLLTLDAFAGRMRDLAAVAAGAPERAEDAEVRKTLEAELRRRPVSGSAVAAALAQVLRARELALGNVNPQLILAELLRGVQAELRGSSSP